VTTTVEDNPASPYYPGAFAPEQDWFEVRYGEGIFVGYRGYDKAGKTPLFPFGHGLSYTTFSVGTLKVKSASDGGATVSFDLKNTGSRAGAEVVQIYVGQPDCSIERPLRELKGFSKVMLQPGESRRVTVDLDRSAFAFWSPTRKAWTVEPDTFMIETGVSARDIRATTSFAVKNNARSGL